MLSSCILLHTPYMYRDYEAQRHWMEITYHLPLRQWYRYDHLLGSGLSTLNAYASWLCGYVRSIISRGLETASSKVYMRATVLIFDALIYIPALVHFITSSSSTRSNRARPIALLTLLSQPSLLLVDNGRFQCDSVMPGLMLQALARVETYSIPYVSLLVSVSSRWHYIICRSSSLIIDWGNASY
jgi:alpha-1,3-glucosyltransferase